MGNGRIYPAIATHDDERFVMEYPSRLFGIAPTRVPGEYGFGDVAYERTSFAVREEGKEWVGTATALWGITAGVYLASIIAGLTDVDAITLSMAELSKEGGSVDQGVAVRAITLAAVSNTLVKTGIVIVAGDKSLRKAVLPGVVLIIAAALGSVFFV